MIPQVIHFTPLIDVPLSADEIKVLSYQFGVNVRVDHLRWHAEAAAKGLKIETTQECKCCKAQHALMEKLELAAYRLSQA